ncbi:hypothetical protein F0U62_13250 [Cystobacter fuscus]|uniref:hypothetical protein n=1 Tax=Cystobacter fuscus TaxID=43 RepID=UPI002B3035D1|nr:hypothetical protein F0U62_13250 [Cystobacter fuscus]
MERPNDITREPFFTFSAGELRRSEFEAFFEKMNQALNPAQGLAIIMNPLDDLNLNKTLLQELSFDAIDFLTLGHGVLYYKSWPEESADIWKLLRMAEPSFIFNVTTTFDALLGVLRKAYSQLDEMLANKGVRTKPEMEATMLSMLLENFSPLLFNVLGEFTLITRGRVLHSE